MTTNSQTQTAPSQLPSKVNPKKLSTPWLRVLYNEELGATPQDGAGRDLSRQEMIEHLDFCREAKKQGLAIVQLEDGGWVYAVGDDLEATASLASTLREQETGESHMTSMAEMQIEDVRNRFFEITGEDPVSLGIEDDPEAMGKLIDEAKAAAFAPPTSAAPDAETQSSSPEDRMPLPLPRKTKGAAKASTEGDGEGAESTKKTKAPRAPKAPAEPKGTPKLKYTEVVLAAAAELGANFTAEQAAENVNARLTSAGQEQIETSYVRAYLQHWFRKGGVLKEGTGKDMKYTYVQPDTEPAAE